MSDQTPSGNENANTPLRARLMGENSDAVLRGGLLVGGAAVVAIAASFLLSGPREPSSAADPALIASAPGRGGVTARQAELTPDAPAPAPASETAPAGGGLEALADLARAQLADPEAPAAQRAFALQQLFLIDPRAASDAATLMIEDAHTPLVLRLAALSAYSPPASAIDASPTIWAALDQLAAQEEQPSTELAAYQAFFSQLGEGHRDAIDAWFRDRVGDEAALRATAGASYAGDGVFATLASEWASSDDAALSEFGWSRLAAIPLDAELEPDARRAALERALDAAEAQAGSSFGGGEQLVAGLPSDYVDRLMDAISARDAIALQLLSNESSEHASNDQLELIFSFVFDSGAANEMALDQVASEFPDRNSLVTFLLAGASAPAPVDHNRTPRNALTALMRADRVELDTIIAPRALASGNDEAGALIVSAWLARLARDGDGELTEATLDRFAAQPSVFASPGAMADLERAVGALTDGDPAAALRYAPALYIAANRGGQTETFRRLAQRAISAAAQSADDGIVLDQLAEATRAEDMAPEARAGLGRELVRAALPALSLRTEGDFIETVATLREAAGNAAQSETRMTAMAVLQALLLEAGETPASYRLALEAANLHAIEPAPIALGSSDASPVTPAERERAAMLRTQASRAFTWRQGFSPNASTLVDGETIALSALNSEGGDYWARVNDTNGELFELRASAALAAILVTDGDGEAIAASADANRFLSPPSAADGVSFIRLSPRDPDAEVEVTMSTVTNLDLSQAGTRASAVEVSAGRSYAADTDRDNAQNAYIRFTAPEAAGYSVYTFDLSEETDTTLSLYTDETGESIDYNDDSNGLASRLSFDAQAGQTIYIGIGHFAQRRGEFRLAIDALPPAVSIAEASDESLAIPMEIGVDHRLSTLGVDGGWISFTTTSGGPYVIETSDLDGVDTTLTATLNGQQLGYNDDGGQGLASRLVVAAEPETTYLVRVGHFAGSTVGGRFTLRIDPM